MPKKNCLFNKGYYDFIDSVFIEPIQDVSNKLEISNCRTEEEWRYYQAIDIQKSDPNPDVKWLEDKRLLMEESFLPPKEKIIDERF